MSSGATTSAGREKKDWGRDWVIVVAIEYNGNENHLIQAKNRNVI
jgi:hypothetical protein